MVSALALRRAGDERVVLVVSIPCEFVGGCQEDKHNLSQYGKTMAEDAVDQTAAAAAPAPAAAGIHFPRRLVMFVLCCDVCGRTWQDSDNGSGFRRALVDDGVGQQGFMACSEACLRTAQEWRDAFEAHIAPTTSAAAVLPTLEHGERVLAASRARRLRCRRSSGCIQGGCHIVERRVWTVIQHTQDNTWSVAVTWNDMQWKWVDMAELLELLLEEGEGKSEGEGESKEGEEGN